MHVDGGCDRAVCIYLLNTFLGTLAVEFSSVVHFPDLCTPRKTKLAKGALGSARNAAADLEPGKLANDC